MKQLKNQAASGFLFTAGAFVIWGFLPLYWSLLFHIPALGVLCHRIVWSWVFVAALLSLGRQWHLVGALFKDKRALLFTALSGLIVNTNWGLYIYAISSGRVLEASMGYYINPLVSALLGALIFGESMRRLQKAAILLVCIGVGYMVLGYGAVPVFALSLAVTFAAYGAIHKYLRMGVLDGLFCEMSVTLLPALFYLGYFNSGPSFFAESIPMMLIIVASGPLTALPLMGYAVGVKRLRLTTTGIIQYLAPTITFLVGVFYFREPVNGELLFVFGLVWAGVLLYLLDGLAFHRLHLKRVQH